MQPYLRPFEQPYNYHMYYLAPNVPPNYPVVQGPFSGSLDAMLWSQWFAPFPRRVPTTWVFGSLYDWTHWRR